MTFFVILLITTPFLISAISFSLFSKAILYSNSSIIGDSTGYVVKALKELKRCIFHFVPIPDIAHLLALPLKNILTEHETLKEFFPNAKAEDWTL